MTDPAFQIAADILADWEKKVLAFENGHGPIPENLMPYQHEFLYEQFDKGLAECAVQRKRYHDIKIKLLYMMNEKLRAQSQAADASLKQLQQSHPPDLHSEAGPSNDNNSTPVFSTVVEQPPLVTSGLQPVDAKSIKRNSTGNINQNAMSRANKRLREDTSFFSMARNSRRRIPTPPPIDYAMEED